MKLYRFSPLSTNAACIEALNYIDEKLSELSSLVILDQLPVNTLKIFSHYKDEYQFLREWANSIGKNEDDGSPTSYYVKPFTPTKVNNHHIEYIGIRVPDPYRAQVGCGDYVVENYDEFKDKYVNNSPHIREVTHQKYEMLELFHPDIDVLGYIVKKYD